MGALSHSYVGSTSVLPDTVVPQAYCSREFYFLDSSFWVQNGLRSAAVGTVYVKVYIFLVSV